MIKNIYDNKDWQKLIGKKVVIIKNYHPVNKDARVTKLLKMLKSEQFDITYLGWNRESKCLSKSDNKGYLEVIMERNAPFGLKSYLFLPFWWFFVFKWLMRSDWDIAHVVNFPSITPVILAGKLRHKPVVYDIEDTTVDQLPVKGLLRTLGIRLERFHTKHVSAVILVDELQNEEFYGIPNNICEVIYDSPPTVSNISHMNRELGIFKIFYAGYLNKEGNLNIESVLEAIRDIENVKITIAGEGNLVEDIKAKASEMPEKIQYLGWIPYDKVLELSFNADMLFSLRDQYPLTHRYICGSKFLEALMCGKPVLVNKGTSTAVKVKKAKCGLVIDAHNINEVREAILKLKNDEQIWKYFALNSIKAYDSKYSWEKMRQRLFDLYFKLLN